MDAICCTPVLELVGPDASSTNSHSSTWTGMASSLFQKPRRAMKTAAYVIHLERSLGRDRNLTKILSVMPVPAQVHSATDGSSLGNAKILEVYKRWLHLPKYPFELRSAEIGTFLSHRSCWMRLLAEGVDAALILEDDIGFDETFLRGFELAREHVRDLEYIQFPVRQVHTKVRILGDSGDPANIRIVEPRVVPLGACAQLVSRTAAERLLEATQRIDRPIDCFLQLRNITGQSIYSVIPSGVGEISRELGGSTIHAKDQQVSWAEREFKRFAYRMKVRRMSRRHWEMKGCAAAGR